VPASEHTFVIAEAGVNHNGSLDLALRLVDVAARAGADAVKFQTFRADKLVSIHAPKAAYQVASTGQDGSQLEMLKSLELSEAAHRALASHCQELGIAFMSTAFDVQSLHFLAEFAMPATKIPSGDVTAAPLVLEAARLRRPIILSTGMCTLADVEEALGVIAFGLTRADEAPSPEAFASALAAPEGQAALAQNVTLLHCVTEYPAALADVNLRAMEVLRDAFGLPVGYSDHTLGTSAILAAVALGATIVEKHFTLDRHLPGPDHGASLEPDELAAMVRGIREIEVAMGARKKEPSPAELSNQRVARRSLVTAGPVRRGELFDTDNLAVKRPGLGKRPIHYWSMLGTPAPRDYAADELLEP
jgi:N-acetylneuraminate synthase